jgi:hypothetical protein
MRNITFIILLLFLTVSEMHSEASFPKQILSGSNFPAMQSFRLCIQIGVKMMIVQAVSKERGCRAPTSAETGR